MSHLQTRVLNHSQRVLKLYKEALRNIEGYHYVRHEYRYHAVLLRARFEENRNIKDMVLAHKLVVDGEEELFDRSFNRIYFPRDPGGVAYMRNPHEYDHMLDYWHPDEKAQYPDYFAKREQRKKEYVDYYRKKFGDYELPKDH
ncbi:NADH dehydrogenase [ubiquinone] 1 beta subcomplex subunit 9-like [Artemia franciscana]|uniref:NADH dehydrogenase [ubiquinone] 1 beta subcomplex subunit 9 n=1 Tax=Artemia franciscana TaxID=6661 RepID=A0AA88IB79_ARTSF|nr:hypothetical protein QYM36_001663 [Artemia franciscana]